MSDPTEVLGQLLSPAQAVTLDATGREAWSAAASALQAIQGASPAISAIDGRLVMPDEITAEFDRPHLAIPLELSTDQDQAATAYLVIETALAAAYLESQADNPDDEEQQTIVIASTVLGQVIQSLNTAVFGRSPAGLILAIDDITANTMPATLATLDDPCLLLRGAIASGHDLEITLVLPGTFLDIMAGAMEGALASDQASGPASAPEFGLGLTQEELEAAELLDVDTSFEPQPASPPPSPPPGPAPASREPTPIGSAARARFAPLAEAPAPAARSGIDLLAGLQMNVTVELGRTELTVAEVLGLGPGSVIELDRIAGEPVDILVNDRLIARGEVVVVDENFGIRVVEVVRRGAEQEASVG